MASSEDMEKFEKLIKYRFETKRVFNDAITYRSKWALIGDHLLKRLFNRMNVTGDTLKLIESNNLFGSFLIT